MGFEREKYCTDTFSPESWTMWPKGIFFFLGATWIQAGRVSREGSGNTQGMWASLAFSLRSPMKIIKSEKNCLPGFQRLSKNFLSHGSGCRGFATAEILRAKQKFSPRRKRGWGLNSNYFRLTHAWYLAYDTYTKLHINFVRIKKSIFTF